MTRRRRLAAARPDLPDEELLRLDAEASTGSEGYCHTRDVHNFTHVQGECIVGVTDWPYDCVSRREHPDHVVYTCRTHWVWWHRSPAELGLA